MRSRRTSKPSQSNPSGIRSLLRRLILGTDTGSKVHRNQLMLESLEHRQLLAGDVELFATEAEVGPNVLSLPAETGALPVTQQPEGELVNDLVAFAQALSDQGVEFFGANWCPACTTQKELFEDGANELPFIEVTGPDRELNAIGIAEGIGVFPTWDFNDGTDRVEGVLTLAEISQRSGIPIPQGEDPTFEAIGNQTVEIGSPLHIPIDVYDPDGGDQIVSITVDNPNLVEGTVLTGNRSIRIDMETYGDMVFELFEQRAPRATGRVVELAEDNFYDGILFHRVVDNFVIQGGDPLGTGTGGSNLGDFDDDYHPDLQHNRGGILSYAKAGDDTNDSQFFITETDTRFLDFNHSVFGVLTEGEDVREAISEHAVDSPQTNRPTINIAIESIDVFADNENSVVMLRALGEATGSTNATITVRDPDGNTHTETIQITVIADAANGQPFLEEFSVPAQFDPGAAQLQLSAIDVEGDTVQFFAEAQDTAPQYTLDINSATGLVTVTPDAGFDGTANVLVGVRAPGSASTDFDSQLVAFNVEGVETNLAAPTSIDLLAGTDTGSSNIDNVTNAEIQTFLVTGVTAGAQVELVTVEGNSVVGTALASGTTATISTTNISTLGDGTYPIFARQILNGVISPASDTLTIVFDSTAPTGVGDTATTTATEGQAYLSDLNSDEEGQGVRYAFTSAPTGASINSSTGVITWTPTAAQVGTNEFGLDVTDTAGNTRSETFNVLVAGLDARIEVKLDLVDADGNAITSAQVGDRFFLNFSAVDGRGALGAFGVFGLYADVFFDSSVVRPVSGTVINYDPGFDALQSGVISDGLIDELGGTSSSTSFSNEIESLIATIEMEAVGVGSANIFSDPSDDINNENLLFNVDEIITAAEISFGSVSLAVGQDFSVADDSVTVAEDSGATTVDVLANDTTEANVSLDVVAVSQPSFGGTTELNNGTVTFSPDADFFGTATFTYDASDGNVTDTATVTVTITAVNDAPTAVADSLTVDQGSSNNRLDVLANDSFAPDVDETLRVSAVGPSENGATLSIAEDGSTVLYTPASDFSGADSFTYTVSDGLLTDSVLVNVTVVPGDAPPTANDDSFALTEDDAEASFDVLANDTVDENGETFSLDSVGTPNQGGTARISDDGGQLLYQPAANFFGEEQVTYTIRDTGGGIGVGTVTFTVAGVNDAPPVLDTTVNANRGGAETTALTIADLPTNVDGDGETLTFSSVGTPTAGGASRIDSATGNILYTAPSDDFVGTDTFTYTVEDGSGLSSSGTITVVVNDFTTRVINLASTFEDTASLSGLRLTGTDALGATVSIDPVVVDGESQFVDVLPGDYNIEVPSIPVLQGAETARSIAVTSAPEDGDTTVDLGIGRIRPEFISIRDWLGSSPSENALVAVTPGESSVVTTLSGATQTLVDASATLNADASSITITGTDESDGAVEATLDTSGNAAVQSRGTIDGMHVFRVDVSDSAVGFTPSSPTTAEGELGSFAGDLPAVAAAVSLPVSGSAEGESIARAVTRVDTFTPAPTTVSGGAQSDGLAPVNGESEPNDAPESTDSTVDSTSAETAENPVDLALRSIRTRRRMLASSADDLQNAVNSEKVLNENAVDSAIRSGLRRRF